MKRTEAQSIKEIIDKAISNQNLSGAFNEQKAGYVWQEIVGPTINRYTTRRYVENGILHVYISSAPLKNELQFLKTKLIAEVNKAVGTNVITNIVIH